MNLNLIQMTGGTVTFAEPEKGVAEAMKGLVLSMPESDWAKAGYPVAVEVVTYNTAFAPVEKSAPEELNKDDADPRSFYL